MSPDQCQINLETQKRTKYDIIVRGLWALTINDVKYHVKLFAVCIRNVIDISIQHYAK